MDTLSMILASDMPSGVWQSIIGWFASFISNYGWTIIVFTICLKLVLSPLDFYQKYSMRKTQRQQALLKPELDRINEKYQGNKQLQQQKMMELYKKNNISPAGGCLPMLLYLVITMFVFFTLFGAMNNISQYKIKNEYLSLQQVYVENYTNFKGDFLSGTKTIEIDGIVYNIDLLKTKADEESAQYLQEDGKYKVGEVTFETKDEFINSFVDTAIKTVAQEKVLENFTANKTSFLWIKNIFRPDNYSSSFPNYNEFVKSVEDLYKVKTTDDNKQYYYESIDKTVGDNGFFYLVDNTVENAQTLNSEMLANAKIQGEIDFNNITKSVRDTYSSWNGYFILVALAGLATVLSQLLANAGAKAKAKDGEEVKITQPVNKVMLIVMPIIMMWFTWGYSAAFALYIVANSFSSILITYLINLIVNKVDAKHEEKALVKISLKDRNVPRVNKQIVGGEIASSDYRIQKKGKIVEQKQEKKPKTEEKAKTNKKDTKNQDQSENKQSNEGDKE